jgi:hypothetical protein
MITADDDPGRPTITRAITSLLQRWHGIPEIIANKDETFATERGRHVGNGIYYACCILRAQPVFVEIMNYFQTMVSIVDRDLVNMPLAAMRDYSEHGLISLFHMTKLDRAFFFAALQRMHFNFINGSRMADARRAAVASGISNTLVPLNISGAAGSPGTSNSPGTTYTSVPPDVSGASAGHRFSIDSQATESASSTASKSF